MRVFVAGGSGVIGRRLIPQLVARGHQVTATTTTADRVALLEGLGATGVVMDGLDAASVGEAVAAARPDTIVNQMTALSAQHAGSPACESRPVLRANEPAPHRGRRPPAGRRRGDRLSHVVAQGHASMNGAHAGSWVRPRRTRSR